MTTSYSGGCACGAVRYETNAAPFFQNHCQCSDCRRRSGTGHGSYLTFAQRSEMGITGKVQEWRVSGDSGNEKSHAFCPACGTPLYLTFAAMPDLIAVHAGSLDAPALFQPKVVTYARHGFAWDVMDPTLASFATMPG